jgi:hypothetical protein
MFQGNVAVPNLSEVDWDNDNDRVPDEVRKGFPEVGEELKASFSINAPAEIEYIVIVSDIEKVSCEMYQNEKMLGVPVRGYVATSRRVNRKEWEDSIRWCSTELEHLTWIKISGGIRCWDQFIYDREDVNDPKSTVGVLAMWGTRSYFDARGYAWEFHGTLELPSRAAEHSDILQMATEAFYAAAGLPKEWPRDITFLAVHCEIAEVMCADPARARAIRIPVRGFLQAPLSRCYKWETWLPKTSAPSWDWNPLRGGLCGHEEFESASTEAKSEGSGWIEIIVEGKLGKNNAGRLADAKQARAAHSWRFFRLQFGSASGSRTHSKCHFVDRPEPHAPPLPRHPIPSQPRPPFRRGAMASSSAAEARIQLPRQVLHRGSGGGGGGSQTR